MRKLVRPEEPEVLKNNAQKWNQQWADLRNKDPNKKPEFEWYRTGGKSAREWILPDLRSMNQGHCCFCDAFPIADTSKEPIEHFRPKSRPEFYCLAYTWTNLFYCCDFCNSEKGETWDEKFLNPDANDYSFERYFMFDHTTGAISPNPKATETDQARAQATITAYGLDKEPKRKYRLLAARNWSRSDKSEIDFQSYRNFLEQSA